MMSAPGAAALAGILMVMVGILNLINAIVALLSIPAYPYWPLAIFTLDILLICGLAAYGGRPMGSPEE